MWDGVGFRPRSGYIRSSRKATILNLMQNRKGRSQVEHAQSKDYLVLQRGSGATNINFGYNAIQYFIDTLLVGLFSDNIR